MFNSLPLEIKIVADNPKKKKFKFALEKFLYNHNFYTLEEYLTHS